MRVEITKRQCNDFDLAVRQRVVQPCFLPPAGGGRTEKAGSVQKGRVLKYSAVKMYLEEVE